MHDYDVSVSVTAGPGYLLVSVAGECDTTTGQQCRDALMPQACRAPRRLIVDLSGVDFMDCAGVRVLLAVHAAAAARGSLLVLACPKPIVARVLSLTGAGVVIPVAGSVAAALGCGR
jgi:anti-anti-sigma factor